MVLKVVTYACTFINLGYGIVSLIV